MKQEIEEMMSGVVSQWFQRFLLEVTANSAFCALRSEICAVWAPAPARGGNEQLASVRAVIISNSNSETR